VPGKGRDTMLFACSWPAACAKESILGGAVVGALGARCFRCGVPQRWFVPVKLTCPGFNRQLEKPWKVHKAEQKRR